MMAIAGSLGRVMAPLWVSISYYHTRDDWAGSVVFAEASATQAVGLIIMGVCAVCVYRALVSVRDNPQFQLRRLPSLSEQL
jgi:hypothetical protein